MKSGTGFGRLVALLLAFAALAVTAGTASATDGKRGSKGDAEKSHHGDRSDQSRSDHEGDDDKGDRGRGDHDEDDDSDRGSREKSSRDGDDDDDDGDRARSREQGSKHGSCSNPCAGQKGDDDDGERRSHEKSKSHHKSKGKAKVKAHVSGETTPGSIAYCYRDASGEWKLGYATAEELARKVESENVIVAPFQVKGKWHSKNWDSHGKAVMDECKNKKASRDGQPSKAKSSGSYKDTSRGEDKKRGHAHKHTICHATGSSTNPYVMITPSVSGVFHGHIGHQGGEDIIPPFTYKGASYSQNWDAAGQALFANGCAAAVVQAPAVDVCPNLAEHQATVPAGFVRDAQGNCAQTPAPAAATDVCVNVEGMQAAVPAGLVRDANGNCAAAPAAQVAAVAPAPVAASAPAAKTEAKVKATAAAPAAVPAAAAAPAGDAAGAVKATEAEAGGVLGAVASPQQGTEATATGGTLPFTGIPLWVAALFGAGLLATGLVLRRAGRREL